MTTRREYAASLGLAIAGARGKLSTAAHEAINKAIAGGMTFTDAPARAFVPSERKALTPGGVKVQTSSEQGAGVYEIATRYSDSQLFTGTDPNGKVWTVDARQACFHCGYSLTSHTCNAPRVLVKSMQWVDVSPKGV